MSLDSTTTSEMLERLLTPDQETLLSEERRALLALHESLYRAGATREDLAALDASVGQLDRLFLLVVVGEFNSGKSTFVNALLGERLLEEGVTPTTVAIQRLVHSASARSEPAGDRIEEIAAPIELLRQLEIVDTPGTNALEREHELLTRRFVPRADLVVFVTSADRPFTESERAFIESIREWGKKLVIVINKIDILQHDEDVWKVTEFVRHNAERILELDPEVFPVSSRLALEAKLTDDDPELAAESRFFELERFLTRTLDETERVRLKLLNPLKVGTRLAERHLESVAERVELLREDISTLEEMERRLVLYSEDMRAAFRFRLTDVDNELHRFAERGDEFFDNTLRLPRVFDLLNKERIQADYERQVVADTPRRLEDKVDETIDWILEAELAQWRETVELLRQRRTPQEDGFAGTLGDFDRTRKQLLDTVGRAAHTSIAGFDHRAEAQRLAESVRTAVAGTALLEVGAVGLGALFTVLATTQLADLTGMLAAGTLAVLGLFVLPTRRRRAKAELSRKVLDLRKRLLDALTTAFDREIERSIERMQEAVSPYTRFVRSRRQELTALEDELHGLVGRLRAIETGLADL